MSAGRIPRQMVRRDFLKMSAVLPVALLVPNTPGPAHDGALPPEVTDAVTRRAHAAVKDWTEWLKRHNVRGYFGETGWPGEAGGSRGDLAQWQALGEKIYSWLDDAEVWATAWTAAPTTGPTVFKVYSPANPEASLAARVIGNAYSQAAVIERHPGFDNGAPAGVRRGMNASGGELHLGMTDEQFSNQNPGVYGQHYVYPSRESLAYLADRGHGLIRLPFRWERVQPVLGGALDGAEVSRIRRCVTDAESVGLKVVLDCHNYAAYAFPDGHFRIGTPRVPVEVFADLWGRLSAEFAGAPSVAGYDLMNEPMDMPGGAAQWEGASQTAVDAVRSAGDSTRVMVAGYHKADGIAGGGAFAFVANHPAAWIEDPARRTRYTTHAYWGHYGYSWTYEESEAWFSRNGSAV